MLGIMAAEKNPKWTGDKVTYRALHQWVYYWLGKADCCEACGTSEIPNGYKRYFDWANLSRKYKRDLGDWIKLCKECHFSSEREARLTANQ